MPNRQTAQVACDRFLINNHITQMGDDANCCMWQCHRQTRRIDGICVIKDIEKTIVEESEMYLRYQGTKWASVALIVVLFEGCATATGENPSFFEFAQQALGAVSMVVGVASGDSSLAENGAQVFDNGRGLSSTGSSNSYAPSSPSSSEESYSDSPTQLAQTSPDLQAMAERCRSNADREIPNANQQNTILKYQACLAWCGYKATNSEQYFRIYSQSQAGANELCGRGANSKCNEIRKAACAG